MIFLSDFLLLDSLTHDGTPPPASPNPSYEAVTYYTLLFAFSVLYEGTGNLLPYYIFLVSSVASGAGSMLTDITVMVSGRGGIFWRVLGPYSLE